MAIDETTSNEEESKKGRFKCITKVNFSDMDVGTELSESDLCIQDSNAVYQFEFVEPEKEKKEEIKPGIFSLAYVAHRVTTKATDIRSQQLLPSIVNTQKIVTEANSFFDGLDIYEELGEPKVRKILLYSDPGMGKTATITKYCQDAIEADPGTVVIVWPTSKIDSDDVATFLSKGSEYLPTCTRLILIMEDIGGGERDGGSVTRSVDSSLLNLLDGIEVTFKLPTLIIATTNYPQNLLSALADRPQRFDLIMKLPPPSYEEKIQLMEFIGKAPLDDRAKEALKAKRVESFSVAHLKEAVIRSRLHRKHVADVIQELADHREKFKNSFEEGGTMGFGGID